MPLGHVTIVARIGGGSILGGIEEKYQAKQHRRGNPEYFSCPDSFGWVVSFVVSIESPPFAHRLKISSGRDGPEGVRRRIGTRDEHIGDRPDGLERDPSNPHE